MAAQVSEVMGVIDKQGASARGALDPARYVFNPSARSRGPALARDFSCDIRLPVRALDRGIDFAELLRKVVTLLLEPGDPSDLLHAVAVRLHSRGRDGSLE